MLFHSRNLQVFFIILFPLKQSDIATKTKDVTRREKRNLGRNWEVRRINEQLSRRKRLRLALYFFFFFKIIGSCKARYRKRFPESRSAKKETISKKQ